MKKTTLKLTKPIMAHGKEISELEFAEPDGGAIRKCGLPYELKEDHKGKTEVAFNPENVALLIEDLAQIPSSSVNKLSAHDFQAAMGLVSGFFGAPTSPKSSPDTST